MPWESKTVEMIREEFVAKALIEGCNFSQLCREYHISRVTGYEWVNRYKEGYDLSDRSHAPLNRPHKTPLEMEELVLTKKVLDAHPDMKSLEIRIEEDN